MYVLATFLILGHFLSLTFIASKYRNNMSESGSVMSIFVPQEFPFMGLASYMMTLRTNTGM